MGSAQLVQSLLPHGLVDELLLFVHPVVLGSGKRLFGADEAAHRFDAGRLHVRAPAGCWSRRTAAPRLPSC